MHATTGTTWCIICGYPLQPATSRTCPECGRAFDPGDPRTTDAKRFATRTRRRRRVLGAVAAFVLVVVLVLPRSVVISTATLTTVGGVRRIVTTTQTVAPRHLRFARSLYPRWTTATDAGVVPTGEEDDFGITVLVGVREFSWRGVSPLIPRLSGTMPSAAGSWPVVNHVPVTLERVPRLSRELARMLAYDESYGISMTVTTKRPDRRETAPADFKNPASRPRN